MATPAGMTSAIPHTSGWDGPGLTIGARVYVPNGNSNQVDCYDASSAASCAGFPKSLPGLSLLYTVNPDPQRSTCIWVNSDGGGSQIQNFDGYTGGACNQWPVRFVSASMIPPGQGCAPSSYSSFQLVSPPPSSYTTATVTIDDGNGNPISGMSNLALDGTGTLNLAGLNLSGIAGLPQFLINLNGTQGTPNAAQVKLTWTGPAGASCQPLTTPPVPSSGSGIGPGVAMAHNPSPCTGKPVNCASGDFFHQFTDISVPGRGPGLSVVRTYNSLAAASVGLFGHGWSSLFDMGLVVNGDQSVTITAEDGSKVTAIPNSAGGYTMPAWAVSTLSVAGGVYSYTRQANLTYTFASSGRLTAVTDRNGYRVSLTYNASGQLSSVADPAGRSVAFSFGVNGLVSSVTDPANQATSYSYDANANLTGVSDPLNRTWTFGYDANHLLLTMRDPDGGVTTNVYDSSGRVLNQTDPANLATSFSYTGNNYGAFGGTTTITYPHGVVAEQFVNGLLATITKGVGTASPSTWSYTYDTGTYGQTSVTDPNGNVTTYIYDANGNVTSASDADQRTTMSTYNPFNEPLMVTDPAGVVTTSTYDTHGNPLTNTVTGVGGTPVETTRYTYGDSFAGDVTQITDPANRVTDYSYDTYGNVASQTTHPTGTVNDRTGFSYDVLGRRICQASPNATATGVVCPAAGQPRVANTTSYTYDADSELTAASDPLANTTSYRYDGDGDRTQIIDALQKVTATAYDADNRPATITAGSGSSAAASTTYGYDIAPGSGTCTATVAATTYCTSVTDPDGHVTTSFFDAQGRQVAQNDPASGLTTSTYDLAGNLAAQTTTAGTATYGHDPANQLLSITYSNPAPGYNTASNVAYLYDADGRRSKMTDGTGATIYGYDSLERTHTVTNGAGATVTYGYDLDNEVNSLGYPNGQTVTYGYDNAGRATTVGDWLSHTTSLSYDNNSNPLSEALPNGDTSTVAYNNADQLTGISDAPTANPANPFATMSYTRDRDGQVTGETDTGLPAPASQTYSYDTRNELTNATATGDYRYDPAGNLVSQPTMTSMAYNGAGQLCYSANSTGTCTANRPPGTGAYTYNTAGYRASTVTSLGVSTAGTQDQAQRPVAVNITRPAGWAKTVAAGAHHELAVKSDGTVWDWGYNTTGQLGNGTTTSSTTPVQVTNLTGVTAVAAGFQHSLALKADGTVWAWGYNGLGQLGNGTSSGPQTCGGLPCATTPVQVSGLAGVVAIAAGGLDNLALKSDGTVWAWGAGGYGQLGNGAFLDSSVPVKVNNLTGVTAIVISVGYGFAAALRADGTVWDWGYNYDGELGNGTTTGSAAPVQVTNLTGVTALATGSRHTLALRGDGTVWAWGYNAYGQLGDGTNSGPQTCNGYPCATTPVQVSNLSGATAVATGQYYSIALTATGAVYSWGTNGYGELGNASTTDTSLPVQARNLTGITAIAGAYATTLALKSDGTMWAWGYNADGEFGNNTTTNSTTPVQSNMTSALQPTQDAHTTATYTYNGDGLRTSKTVNGATSQQTWNSNTPTGTPQILADGNTNYIYSPDGLPLEQITNTATLYYLHDQIGSTRLIANQTGATLTTYTYTPYGQTAATTGTLPPGNTNPLGYTGAYTDPETGFIYLINRYYDPSTAAFLTRDPLVKRTRSAYGYSEQDPLNHEDPSGLCGCAGPPTLLTKNDWINDSPITDNGFGGANVYEEARAPLIDAHGDFPWPIESVEATGRVRLTFFDLSGALSSSFLVKVNGRSNHCSTFIITDFRCQITTIGANGGSGFIVNISQAIYPPSVGPDPGDLFNGGFLANFQEEIQIQYWSFPLC